jgi:hypothetical protein
MGEGRNALRKVVKKLPVVEQTTVQLMVVVSDASLKAATELPSEKCNFVVLMGVVRDRIRNLPIIHHKTRISMICFLILQ